MSELHHLALPAGHVLGKYRLERVLGSGGFAITYLAVDTNLNRKVAIKELMPSDLALRLPDLSVAAKSPAESESFKWARSRFLDEARNIARFEHPNLVRVFEHFEMNKTAYIVMTYIEGDDLNDYLKGVVPAPVDTLVKLVDPLLGALRVMHRSGFLHRDIKPDNIRITPEGIPTLIDFGSARHAVGARTRDLTTILTPRYAPFEQYSEKGNLGPWTDIYSLACVVHKTLRGTAPPEATDRERNDPYIPLAGDSDFADYPQTFLNAVDIALCPHESERPQNADDWRALLWQEVDLPTGFTRIPSGRNVTINQIPFAPVVPEDSPPPTSDRKRRSPIVLLLGLLAFTMLGAGAWLLSKGETKNDKGSGDKSVVDNSSLSLLSSIEKETAPKDKETDTGLEPAPTPPLRPSDSKYTDTGAAELYRQGDRLFLDISNSQFRKKSAADSLDGYHKGIDSESWDEQMLAAVKLSITARDKEIETLSKDSITALERLQEWPEPVRRKGYEIRDSELKLAKAEDKVDTDLQRSLLQVFRSFEKQIDSNIKIDTDLIKARIWEEKLKNISN